MWKEFLKDKSKYQARLRSLKTMTKLQGHVHSKPGITRFAEKKISNLFEFIKFKPITI